MYQVLYVVTGTLRLLITALQFLMMARAVISWFPIEEDSPVLSFLYAVTEPVITPVRAIFDHFGWFEELPIDISFFVTFILLSMLSMLL